MRPGSDGGGAGGRAGGGGVAAAAWEGRRRRWRRRQRGRRRWQRKVGEEGGVELGRRRHPRSIIRTRELHLYGQLGRLAQNLRDVVGRERRCGSRPAATTRCGDRGRERLRQPRWRVERRGGLVSRGADVGSVAEGEGEGKRALASRGLQPPTGSGVVKRRVQRNASDGDGARVVGGAHLRTDHHVQRRCERRAHAVRLFSHFGVRHDAGTLVSQRERSRHVGEDERRSDGRAERGHNGLGRVAHARLKLTHHGRHRAHEGAAAEQRRATRRLRQRHSHRPKLRRRRRRRRRRGGRPRRDRRRTERRRLGDGDAGGGGGVVGGSRTEPSQRSRSWAPSTHRSPSHENTVSSNAEPHGSAPASHSPAPPS